MDLKFLYERLQSEFGFLSRYEKDAYRLDYLVDATQYVDIGNSFWLPSLGTEVIDFLNLLDTDVPHAATKILVCEQQPDIFERISPFYRDLGCTVIPAPLRLHEAIDFSAEPFAFGHADFEGMVGSQSNRKTSTYTFELIKRLRKNTAKKALFAFTHYKKMRNASVLRTRYRNIYLTFEEQYPGILSQYVDFLELNTHNFYSGDFTSNNQCRAYHPFFVLAFEFANVYGNEYLVEPWQNTDYESTSYSNSNELKMNKSVIRLEKGEFDPHFLMSSLKASY